MSSTTTLGHISLATLNTENNTSGKFAKDQTYTLMPSAKNEIIVRFENMADRFDSVGTGNPSKWNIDIQKFAIDLYQEVNSGVQPEVVKIEELDLQGVHPLKGAKKFKWLSQGPP